MSAPNDELVPNLRLLVLRAVDEAENSKTKRGREKAMATAYAYCKAIELANADNSIEPRHGICTPEVGTYTGWMVPAGIALWTFLGRDAWEKLGFAEVLG